MSNKLVSIIIPAYNAEAYIEECVESLLNQSYHNIQVIIVNDGSADRTEMICNTLKNKDARITVIHQSNYGVSVARNNGIMQANGELVAFADADDTWEANGLEKLINILENNNVDAVFGNCSLVYNDKVVKRNARISEGNYSKEELYGLLIDDGTLSGIVFGSVWGAIYKMDLLRSGEIRFRPNLKINEDGIFNIEYCLLAKKIYYTNEPVYNYRQWKNTKQPQIDMLIDKFNNANQVIQEICAKETVLSKQLRNRNMFCIFQISLAIAELPIKEAVKRYRDLWDLSIIKQDGNNLNYTKMNNYKKFLWLLIEHKCYKLFYCMIHSVYPMLKRVIKR